MEYRQENESFNSFNKNTSQEIVREFFQEFNLATIAQELQTDKLSQDMRARNLASQEEDYDVHMQVHGLEIHLSFKNETITHYYIFPIKKIRIDEWHDNFQGSINSVGKYTTYLIAKHIALQISRKGDSSERQRKNTQYSVGNILGVN